MTTGTPRKCDRCGQNFESGNALHAHVRLEHNPGQYIPPRPPPPHPPPPCPPQRPLPPNPPPPCPLLRPPPHRSQPMYPPQRPPPPPIPSQPPLPPTPPPPPLRPPPLFQQQQQTPPVSTPTPRLTPNSASATAERLRASLGSSAVAVTGAVRSPCFNMYCIKCFSSAITHCCKCSGREEDGSDCRCNRAIRSRQIRIYKLKRDRSEEIDGMRQSQQRLPITGDHTWRLNRCWKEPMLEGSSHDQVPVGNDIVSRLRLSRGIEAECPFDECHLDEEGAIVYCDFCVCDSCQKLYDECRCTLQ